MPEYPGLGMPLRFYESGYRDYCPHDLLQRVAPNILLVREVAMMIIMDRLMDKKDWERKVFDEEIITKWRKEALDYPDDLLRLQATGDKRIEEGQIDIGHVGYNAQPLTGIMSNGAFDYCVKELRHKARYYEKTGLIPTLDACASVVKSDKLVPSELREELREAFRKLKADQSASPDWHPNSNDMVQDLLHPSMYPLVYGKSRVFQEELVGVDDAVERWAGKGEVISTKHLEEHSKYSVPASYWSNTYQWLPSNIAFKDDDGVALTSYINNLHPNKYRDIYSTVEKLIERALPAWDQCIKVDANTGERTGAGRMGPRFSKPAYPDDDNPDNWEGDPPSAEDYPELDLSLSDDYARYERIMEEWQAIRKPVQPEPDPFNQSEDYYVPKAGARLAEKFKYTGLQVIVKMASIELTPEKPEFPAGGWHIEGQMNEHICATALYYFDSENITSSSVSFRVQSGAEQEDDYETEQDKYHWLEQVYGTNLGDGGSPALQNYGSVETREGTLLVFPNVFQHRVSPFRLTDPTKPGHRRFIALWLVDPHLRIISTANVPPQQQDWWAEAICAKSAKSMAKLPTEVAQLLAENGVPFPSTKNEKGILPPEVMSMVRNHFNNDGGGLLMSEDDAKKHRDELMRERGAFVERMGQQWYKNTYCFCEH